MHPLAYRDWLNKIPDNSVDAMQWAIININTNEPHYQDKNEGWNVCNGLELFNDFTYIRSYNGVDPNGGSAFAPLECPEFAVPCRNGEEMNGVTENQKYIWWFNTYPLEYGEFLLVTALSRGVWLQPIGQFHAWCNIQRYGLRYTSIFLSVSLDFTPSVELIY